MFSISKLGCTLLKCVCACVRVCVCVCVCVRRALTLHNDPLCIKWRHKAIQAPRWSHSIKLASLDPPQIAQHCIKPFSYYRGSVDAWIQQRLTVSGCGATPQNNTRFNAELFKQFYQDLDDTWILSGCAPSEWGNQSRDIRGSRF